MSDTANDRTTPAVDRRQDPLDLVFGPLDQVAPGSDASTLEALAGLHPIPEGGAVLDLGCGPGRQTLALARTLDRPVTAVDVNRRFLDRLIVRAEAAGLGEQVAVREASMVALDAPPASVDLIWSEGAVYIVGVDAALRHWWPLLKPDACVAFTDLVWLVDTPPAPAASFWRLGYPAMTGMAETRAACARHGYEVVGTRVLPAADWQQQYYEPLDRRIDALRPQAGEWPELATLLDELAAEIALFNAHHGSFGYAFFLLRKPSRTVPHGP